MSKKGIPWTDETVNAWRGCPDDGLKCDGCLHCYTEYFHVLSGTAFNKITYQWDQLKKLKKYKPGTKVFINSMSDTFHTDVPFENIDILIECLAAYPYLIFQLLTKRSKRMYEYFSNFHTSAISGLRKFKNDISDDDIIERIGKSFKNLWLGVSVSNPDDLNEHAPYLLKVKEMFPHIITYISYEPALEKVDFSKYLKGYWECACGITAMPLTDDTICNCKDVYNEDWTCREPIDWIICGGESGQEARPMHPDWAKSAMKQCKDAGIPYFFKGWGAWYPDRKAIFNSAKSVIFGNTVVHKVGKEKAGRLLDGKVYNEFPGGEL